MMTNDVSHVADKKNSDHSKRLNYYPGLPENFKTVLRFAFRFVEATFPRDSPFGFFGFFKHSTNVNEENASMSFSSYFEDILQLGEHRMQTARN